MAQRVIKLKNDEGDVLVPLNISIDNINAETLQDTYSKRICVIVPTVDKFDPDFHRFRREFDSEGLSNKSSESVKAISPPPRPLPRPFASRKGNKANPVPPPRPPPPPSPSPPVVSETPEYERFCFCCAAPFERAPDEATCEEWYAELEEQHMRTCPRQ
ncbi:hypothetical protein OC861_006887 [Tilletia horrida]|nr:hypothetical protein OC861_006887 [Tilletia horrida]